MGKDIPDKYIRAFLWLGNITKGSLHSQNVSWLQLVDKENPSVFNKELELFRF